MLLSHSATQPLSHSATQPLSHSTDKRFSTGQKFLANRPEGFVATFRSPRLLDSCKMFCSSAPQQGAWIAGPLLRSFSKRETGVRASRGFTLMEILIVVSVLAILTGIIVPRIKGFQEEANQQKAKAGLKTLEAAVESYKIHNQAYPSALTDLPNAIPQIVDTAALVDPLASPPANYRYSADGGYYSLSSVGLDGVAGTGGIQSDGNVPTGGDDLVKTNGASAALDTQTDDNNCGTLDHACAAGEACTAGQCLECSADLDCASGYSCSSGSCADINECNLGTDNCDVNATCANTAGAFTCTCDVGYEGDGATCADIDECATAVDDCDANATCTNTPSSFSCVCNAGYSGDGTSGNCTIITYAVTFDSQSATVNADPTSKTVTAPATTVVSLPTAPTKTGNTFGGWYTQTNGNGSQFLANTAVSGNITVYAKWTDVCAGTPAVGTVCADGTKYVSATLRTTTSDAGTMRWSTQYIVTGATSTTNGSTNTATLAGLAGVYPAADYCAGLSFGGHDDWYLPAKDELAVLRVNRAALGGDQTNWYWSSTEGSNDGAWRQGFGIGNQYNGDKTFNYYVRCVRSN